MGANTTTLSFLPYQNQQVFFIESDSTVYDLAFNNETSTLSFNITGPSGTTGYVKGTISKILLANGENLRVHMDGKALNYSVTSTVDSWVDALNYSQSTHQISIRMGNNNILKASFRQLSSVDCYYSLVWFHLSN